MSFREEQMGKFFMGNRQDKLIIPEDPLAKEIRQMKQEKEEKEMNEALINEAKRKQAELEEKLERLELMPVGPRIIVQPYPNNPYRKIMEGSIIVDYGETFKNPDSGEYDKLAAGVICAQVIEVGPECKWIKPGDDVFCQNGVMVPVPFFSSGYKTLAEQQVLAIVSENLKERFSNEREG